VFLSVIYRHTSYLFCSFCSHEDLIMFFPDIQDIAFSLTQCLQAQSTLLLFLKIFFVSSLETDYQDGFKQPHLCFIISALCGNFSRSHNLVALSHFLSIFQVCSY
jgi:hypothetical protein